MGDQAQQIFRERLQARDNNTLPAVHRGQGLIFGGWAEFYLKNFSTPPFRAEDSRGQSTCNAAPESFI
jgi:hypothetical protein